MPRLPSHALYSRLPQPLLPSHRTTARRCVRACIKLVLTSISRPSHCAPIMNSFVNQTVQYLAMVVESAAGSPSYGIRSPASITHGIPPNEASELEASGSPPCSPLVMPSPLLSADLLDFHQQQSALQATPTHSVQSPLERPNSSIPRRSEADASVSFPTPDSTHDPERSTTSVLFQPNSSASAYAASSPQVGFYHSDNRSLSDQPSFHSFESVVYALAAEALSASTMNSAPAVSQVFYVRVQEDALIKGRFRLHRTPSKNALCRKLWYKRSRFSTTRRTLWP